MAGFGVNVYCVVIARSLTNSIEILHKMSKLFGKLLADCGKFKCICTRLLEIRKPTNLRFTKLLLPFSAKKQNL